jgi:hypothetical protein
MALVSNEWTKEVLSERHYCSPTFEHFYFYCYFFNKDLHGVVLD